MTRLHTSLFTASALFYLIVQELPAFPLLWLFKVLPISLLAWSVIRHPAFQGKILLSLALLFSACGDLLLAFGYFVPGLAAFLVAQLHYATQFGRNWQSLSRRLPFTIGLTFYVLLMAVLLRPNLGQMALPVMAYLVVIYSMGMLALQSRLPILPALGALAFIVSDSLIAVNRFILPVPMSSLLIMLTYYSAQWMLIEGNLRSARAD